MSIDWAAYAKGVQAELVQLRKDLEPLEAGTMTLGERFGNGPWRDVTQEAIERNRRAVATNEAILEDVLRNRVGNG